MYSTLTDLSWRVLFDLEGVNMKALKTKKSRKTKQKSSRTSPVSMAKPKVPLKPVNETVTCRKCRRTYVPDVSFDFYPDGDDPKVGRCERCLMTEELAPKLPQNIPTGHDKEVCKFGQGPATCAFLIIAGEDGLQCAKGSGYERVIQTRLSEGTMRAKGEYCSGPPEFKPS